MSENFFERWSRRKQQGEAAPAEEVKLPPPPGEGRGGGATAPAAGAAGPHPDLPPEGGGEKPEAEAAPPTLADAESLTPESDFKPFVARNVAPEVRNAAMKKLFADPHFNVMDRMDVYIDDYSNPAPLPASSLRKMASAVFLKLVDDDEEEARKKKALQETPPMSSVQDVAKSQHSRGDIPSPPTAQQHEAQARPASQETDDDHADLRLQQDDAPDADDPRRGAG
ncbi:DUF3306 domain-containing protein [Variovorax sp. LARHSF232]